MCFSFLLTLYYLYSTSKLDYKMWDVDTVTAADFTVETVISQEMWEKFKKQRGDNEDNENLMNAFNNAF